MKVLYVGGTGEISHACVAESVRAGHEVAVFNRGRAEEPLPGGVREKRGNMDDDAAYRPLGEEGFDVVCQFLAYEPATVERDLEVFGDRVAQYVFISTASAYQKPPRRLVITEDVPLENPFWDYSRAKAAAERTLLQAHAAGRMPVTIVRPSHTHRRRFPGGIASGDHWAWRMHEGRPIVVHGDGTGLWTLTPSEDFARPFVGLLGNDRALGEAFHITRHMESYTWNRIFETMGRALGVEPRLVHVPTETLVRYHSPWAGPLLGDKAWPVLFDNTKVMDVAGEFECRVDLDAAMRGAAAFYRKRAETYAPDEALHALLDRIAADQEALGAD